MWNSVTGEAVQREDHLLRIQERAEAFIRELELEPPPSPALGWSCSYVPQELILAAGLTPVRIPTHVEEAREQTQSYLPPNLCPYVHRLLQAGLSRGLTHLQGTVFVSSCDPMRRLADIWELYSRHRFLYRMEMPRREDRPALEFFLRVLENFRLSLQDLTGRKILAEDLRRAVTVLNRTRRIMRELDLLRAMPRSAITSAQLQRIALCAESMSRERFNEMGAAFLSRIRRDLLRECRALPGMRQTRLFLAGCVVEDDGLHRLIEEAGARVVADSLCSGMRHFRGQVEENAASPLEAVAARYLHRLKCPRMVGRGERVRALVSQARKSYSDGVVLHTLTFCDLHQMEVPAQQEALREANIPCLHLEREHLSGEDAGQLRTRVQAFTELLSCRNKGLSVAATSAGRNSNG